MRINEIILEQEQLDELSLAGIGKNIGAAAGMVGRGVGNVKGAWQGAKAAYTQGRDSSARIAARNVAGGGNARVTRTPPTGTPPTGTPPTPTGTPPTGTPPTPTGTPPTGTPPTGTPVGMKADQIVKGISDVWGKARASQDSQTSSPKVQQLIKAMGKEAGMTGQTIAENKRVGFRSNFLGMDI
jgi:hypothetical protein